MCAYVALALNTHACVLALVLVCMVAGQGAGLIYGAAEGMKMSKNEGYSSKVRTTVVTSQMAKRGMFLGNTFGVLGEPLLQPAAAYSGLAARSTTI